MKILTSKNRFFCLFNLLFFIVSCHNTNTQKTQEPNEMSHDEKMGKITELYNSGEYETFIKLAENELNNTENDFEFFLALSNAYGNLGNYDKTFYYAEKLLEKEPTNYYALLALGNYYFVLEKLDSAEFYYNKVLSINPNYARANLNLAQLFVKKGEKNKAIEQYIKAIELFNQNNFEDEVLLYSKEVLKLDPENKIAKEYIDKLKM